VEAFEGDAKDLKANGKIGILDTRLNFGEAWREYFNKEGKRNGRGLPDMDHGITS